MKITRVLQDLRNELHKFTVDRLWNVIFNSWLSFCSEQRLMHLIPVFFLIPIFFLEFQWRSCQVVALEGRVSLTEPLSVTIQNCGLWVSTGAWTKKNGRRIWHRYVKAAWLFLWLTTIVYPLLFIDIDLLLKEGKPTVEDIKCLARDISDNPNELRNFYELLGLSNVEPGDLYGPCLDTTEITHQFSSISNLLPRRNVRTLLTRD